MGTLRILHFSDLHAGLKGQQQLFPIYRDDVLGDLDKVLARRGPVHLILFTGDLTQSGTEEELRAFDETMGRVTEHLKSQLGTAPLLLAVPGNHDLARPAKLSPVHRALQYWNDDDGVREEFWGSKTNDYHQCVAEAFRSYDAWWNARTQPPPEGATITQGFLPGDFSATLLVDGVLLGVVGLNTAFLQLQGGNYKGRLDVDLRQLQRACPKDLGDWFRGHAVTLLMTHHPPDWLSDRGRAALEGEIARPGHFTAHLFGHMHESRAAFVRNAGDETVRELQGPSLFGLETFGDTQERRLGYSLMEFAIQGDKGEMSLWPRDAQKVNRTLRFGPSRSYALRDDNRFVEPFDVRTGVARASSDAPVAVGEIPPPGGPFNPQWYVSREAVEGRALEFLRWPGRPAILYGARGYGRTWTLVRLTQRWHELFPSGRVVRINLKSLSVAARNRIEGFTFQLAESIVHELDLDEKLLASLDPSASPASAMNRLRRFLVRDVLKGEAPVLLALDDADAIPDPSVRAEFYGGIRSWTEESADAPINRLRLLMSVSTPVSQLIVLDGHRSVWSTTQSVDIPTFADRETRALAERFGLRIDAATIDALLATTGGVPMRVADALHRMATSGRAAT